MEIVLGLCAAAAVVGPFLSRRVEQHYPLFLLSLGAPAAWLSGRLNESALTEALLRPLQLCLALVAGALLLSLAHKPLALAAAATSRRLGPRAGTVAGVLAAAAAAPFITGTAAALLLVELLRAVPMSLERRREAAVMGISAVGLTAGLSAAGSPAAAVVLSKLTGAPYPVGPWLLFDLVGPWVLSGAVALAVAAGVLAGDGQGAEDSPDDPLALWSILVLTGRLFAATCGLILLGAGVLPALEGTLRGVPPWALYWLNMVSAVLDNGVLAAVEFDPGMLQDQLRFAYCGILAADPLLVIAAAPNMVAAARLGISPRTWAQVGIPAGAALYICCFLALTAAPG